MYGCSTKLQHTFLLVSALIGLNYSLDDVVPYILGYYLDFICSINHVNIFSVGRDLIVYFISSVQNVLRIIP